MRRGRLSRQPKHTLWAKKREATNSVTDFQCFYTRRLFLAKLAVKWLLQIPKPHLEYVATLPCETLMS